jgi:vacuolar protein sorting-associated protein 13A/C
VSVYSPYVLLNKTGLELNIKSKSLLQAAKPAAGLGAWAERGQGESCKALPYLFSYSNDDGQNRVVLKLGDSGWSKPQSLDAIGSDVEVVLPSASKDSEMLVGLSVEQSHGKVSNLASPDVMQLTVVRSIK